jgi:hypothetical protein
MSEQITTREEAQTQIKEWAACLEVDTELEYFRDVVDELTLPVMNGRLDFNVETERFTYILLKPIEKKDGSGKIEMVEIRETTMEDNKTIQRYGDKERVDQAQALVAKACGLEIGFASRLHQRDIGKINAVSLGFFVQAAGQKG